MCWTLHKKNHPVSVFCESMRRILVPSDVPFGWVPKTPHRGGRPSPSSPGRPETLPGDGFRWIRCVKCKNGLVKLLNGKQQTVVVKTYQNSCSNKNIWKMMVLICFQYSDWIIALLQASGPAAGPAASPNDAAVRRRGRCPSCHRPGPMARPMAPGAVEPSGWPHQNQVCWNQVCWTWPYYGWFGSDLILFQKLLTMLNFWTDCGFFRLSRSLRHALRPCASPAPSSREEAGCPPWRR